MYVSDTTNVVIDINGYFALASDSTMAFYPLTPCRVADTRNPNDQGLGAPSLSGGVPRDFPILKSNCAIPGSALAYSLNFTAVPHVPLDSLTVWPAGQPQPGVSTLNGPTSTDTANASIRRQTGGDIEVLASNDSDLVIDINGYFAAPGSGGLSQCIRRCHAACWTPVRTTAGASSWGRWWWTWWTVLPAMEPGTGLRPQCDGGPTGSVGIPDHVAGRRYAAVSFDAECG